MKENSAHRLKSSHGVERKTLTRGEKTDDFTKFNKSYFGSHLFTSLFPCYGFRHRVNGVLSSSDEVTMSTYVSANASQTFS